MLIIKTLLLQIKVKKKDMLFLTMLNTMNLPPMVRERINKSKMEDKRRRIHTKINSKRKMHH